ncbi:hypothetical protein PR048_003559 [Dryococelus australis]|uniref:Uncharacterized protein n=1 Tax=Dryococelus australis TaxID=614101 RepID=A0ABQ9INF6_9NEOP|nr:hypothetical protein PR048_003559 [Dryococelus australis]
MTNLNDTVAGGCVLSRRATSCAQSGILLASSRRLSSDRQTDRPPYRNIHGEPRWCSGQTACLPVAFTPGVGVRGKRGGRCHSPAGILEVLHVPLPLNFISAKGEPGSSTRRVHSRIFACGYRGGRCRWLADFLVGVPFYPAPALKTMLLRAVQFSLHSVNLPATALDRSTSPDSSMSLIELLEETIIPRVFIDEAGPSGIEYPLASPTAAASPSEEITASGYTARNTRRLQEAARQGGCVTFAGSSGIRRGRAGVWLRSTVYKCRLLRPVRGDLPAQQSPATCPHISVSPP